MEDSVRSLIERIFEDGKTHEQVKNILQDSYDWERGFSVNSTKRYCRKHNLSPRIDEKYIDEIVAEAVDEVNLQSFNYILHVFYFYMMLLFSGYIIYHYFSRLARHMAVRWWLDL